MYPKQSCLMANGSFSCYDLFILFMNSAYIFLNMLIKYAFVLTPGGNNAYILVITITSSADWHSICR